MLNSSIRKIIGVLENLLGFFIIFKIRKIKIGDLTGFPSYRGVGADIALILQGPIMEKNDFTYETVKYYRHLYPDLRIIISTWKGVDQRLVEKFAVHNVIILQNERPSFAGESNVNLQIKSTSDALHFAKKNGVKFALKSRTDQRINSFNNYLNYFESIVENFPLNNQPIQKRLVICNLNMFKNRHYIVSDMFMFGEINDMLLYWNVPHQQAVGKYDKSKNFLANNMAEAYFVNFFQTKMQFKPKGTFEDSKLFFEEFFYVLDKNVIDLFWSKYNHNYERTAVWVDNQLDFPYSTIDFLPIKRESIKS